MDNGQMIHMEADACVSVTVHKSGKVEIGGKWDDRIWLPPNAGRIAAASYISSTIAEYGLNEEFLEHMPTDWVRS